MLVAMNELNGPCQEVYECLTAAYSALNTRLCERSADLASKDAMRNFILKAMHRGIRLSRSTALWDAQRR